MIRPLFSVVIAFGVFFSGMHSNDLLGNAAPSTMHEMQRSHPDTLSKTQRVVLHRLSPKYQRIFLHALTEDERDEVTSMYHRGDNPYRVINSILQKERRKEKRKNSFDHNEKREKREYSGYYQGTADDENEYTFDEEDNRSSKVEKKSTQRSYRNYYPGSIKRESKVTHPKGIVDGSNTPTYKYRAPKDRTSPRFTRECKGSYTDCCSDKRKNKKKKYKYVESSSNRCNCCPSGNCK